MRFNSLTNWLQWQASLNSQEIDLGLNRVTEVLKQLSFSDDFFCPVISLAGTNGKGSTTAFIESILVQSEHKVGSYTSPHLFAYNERIKINQKPVSDEVLCDAFNEIDQARGDIALTYFEFATLAALVVFKHANVDVAVLEVGLGGRLDAVNVINADVSIITSIDIDHTDWLGHNVENIAWEKAGIMRPHKPSVISLFQPPKSLLRHAQENNVPLVRLGQDYLYQGVSKNHWQLNWQNNHFADLPMPALKGGFQLQNASAAIMAIVQQVTLAGRYQQISENPLVTVDVAHNRQSADKLAELLSDTPNAGKTIGVVAMLGDKAIADVLNAIKSEIDHWVSAGLFVGRGMTSKNMAQAVRNVQSNVKLSACETVSEACAQALALAQENDRIIVFGSFYTVAEAIMFIKTNKAK